MSRLSALELSRMRRRPARYWRVKGDGTATNYSGALPGARVDATDRDIAHRLLGGFDELAVGDWIHLERMDSRVWFMRVGAVDFSIYIPTDPDKAVEVRITEGELDR